MIDKRNSRCNIYLGKIEGVGVKSKKYDLEATEYVTEIYAHFPQVEISMLS